MHPGKRAYFQVRRKQCYPMSVSVLGKSSFCGECVVTPISIDPDHMPTTLSSRTLNVTQKYVMYMYTVYVYARRCVNTKLFTMTA